MAGALAYISLYSTIRIVVLQLQTFNDTENGSFHQLSFVLSGGFAWGQRRADHFMKLIGLSLSGIIQQHCTKEVWQRQHRYCYWLDLLQPALAGLALSHTQFTACVIQLFPVMSVNCPVAEPS